MLAVMIEKTCLDFRVLPRQDVLIRVNEVGELHLFINPFTKCIVAR